MDTEYAEISTETADAINTAQRVIAVGTSVTRTLESAATKTKDNQSSKKNDRHCDPAILPFSGFANLFIYPGYEFKIIDHLITNFHLPCSTPLLLVCAFANKELIFKAYEEAIRDKYRFYSYGDSMLII